MEKGSFRRVVKVRTGIIILGAFFRFAFNGHFLARSALLDRGGLDLAREVPELGRTLGEELLQPTRIYVSIIKNLWGQVEICAMTHITGGGIQENLARVLPDGLGAVIEGHSLHTPPIFELIQRLGQVERSEMFRTFNMGVGFLIIVGKDLADRAARVLAAIGEPAWQVGVVSSDVKGVVIT